jgi:acyl carrier protein
MPVHETVMVAVRCAVVELAVAVAINVLLLLPLDFDSVSHVALLVTVHDWLDVTVKAVEAPPAATKL